MSIFGALTRSLAVNFTRDLLHEARSAGLPVAPQSIDHLCFRVATSDEYKLACDLISSESSSDLPGILLVESMVNGRPISAFKLKEPLIVDDQVISVIEIPAPKPGRPYVTGFEHFEVVLAISFSEFLAGIPESLRETLAADGGDAKELVWDSEAGVVKFHHQSLERIIETELRAGSGRA